MSDVAIKVESLGKKYKIGRKKSGNLRESLANLFSKAYYINKSTNQPASPAGRQFNGDFWALKDINFEVKQGEAVGIIGRNGAGKSTLLKILSRITKPSTGRFEINGRVSSLLEVGTGFHMELTGRENIYLNGTILGMKRREIKEKFDEIVAFSGVEEFIDTPVKHYSSGMKVRLAFSVAAHLEPEILIIDEVLAVGDAEFQKKCLGKMEDVAGQGRTVLFVSHNMEAVRKLCNRAIFLNSGLVKIDSEDVELSIEKYIKGERESFSRLFWNNSDTAVNDFIRIENFGVTDSRGNVCENLIQRKNSCWVAIQGKAKNYDPSIELGYQLCSAEGQLIFVSYFYDSYVEVSSLIGNDFKLKSRLPIDLLNEGRYYIELIGGLRNRVWFYGPKSNSVKLFFELRGNLSKSPMWNSKRAGILAPVIKWEIES